MSQIQIDFEKISKPPQVSFDIDLGDVDEENLVIHDFEEDDTIRLQHEIDDSIFDNGYVQVAK